MVNGGACEPPLATEAAIRRATCPAGVDLIRRPL
jgi:small subunit ribosomal protein S10